MNHAQFTEAAAGIRESLDRIHTILLAATVARTVFADSHGHEHIASGPRGGQFAPKSSGGSSAPTPKPGGTAGLARHDANTATTMALAKPSAQSHNFAGDQHAKAAAEHAAFGDHDQAAKHLARAQQHYGAAQMHVDSHPNKSAADAATAKAERASVMAPHEAAAAHMAASKLHADVGDRGAANYHVKQAKSFTDQKPGQPRQQF